MSSLLRYVTPGNDLLNLSPKARKERELEMLSCPCNAYAGA